MPETGGYLSSGASAEDNKPIRAAAKMRSFSTFATMVDDAERHRVEAPSIVHTGEVTALASRFHWFEGGGQGSDAFGRDGLGSNDAPETGRTRRRAAAIGV